MSNKQHTRNQAEREHAQRLEDMRTLEVRRGVDQPWERVRDVAPDLVARLQPGDDGVVDERILIAWAMGAGDLVYVPTIDPACPLAFRLSGQYCTQGGWQLAPDGAQRLRQRWLI